MKRICLLLACIPGLLPAKVTAETRPNIIVVLCDDLGYGDVAGFGYEDPVAHTPHIDQLAAQGVRLTRFLVPMPYCAPSRASLLTGRFPYHTGVVYNPTPDQDINDYGLAPEETTIAEVLRSGGYRTACVGKWHLGHKPRFLPTRQGFDYYLGVLYSNDMRPVQLVENEQVVDYPVVQAHLTRRYTEASVDFIRAAAAESQPFFLYLAHAMPHKPLAASEDYYTPETAGDLYEDVIRELDGSVGDLVGELKRLQIDRNTLLIFTSDNGPWYGGRTGGLRGMKATSWDGGLRVPFIARWPGRIPAGIVNASLASSVDLFPTIVELAGLSPGTGSGIDGENLWPQLVSAEAPSAHAFLPGMHRDRLMAIYSGPWKLHCEAPRAYRPPGNLETWKDRRGPDGVTLIAPFEQHTPRDYPGLISGAEPRTGMLFDVTQDPGEQTDISARHPEVVERLTGYAEATKLKIPDLQPPRATSKVRHIKGGRLDFWKEPESASKPNVVIFYADDFGWGDLRDHNPDPAAFRYTPNMDRIFTEGVELRNYMTHCVCSPSRAGLLTGKHYARVGAGPRTGGTLPNDIRNLAKDFQAAGYKTGAFGKWHNGMPNFPEEGNGARVDYNRESTWSELHGEKTLNLTNNVFENHKGWKWGEGVNAYGFDRWVGYYNGGGDLFDRYVDWHHDVDWWHDRSYRGDEKGYTTDLITRYAIEFIDEHRTEPFLCYIPHEAVHNPLQLKRSDLREFCEKLDAELGIKGQWDYVRNIVSPKTGNRIGDVAELRCDRRQEFDVRAIDPDQAHYAPLVYAAYVYTLDKSIGAVIRKVEDIARFEDTIFLFASDNGATSKGINAPLKGGKHSMWEGGVHVPAAIWWPGTLDRSTPPYAPGDTGYEGFISYLDLYPTLMSMSGQPCLGRDLDGLDCWSHLRERTECRPDMTDAMYWMWLDHGAVRTRRWKLLYSESRGRAELYDLEEDLEETTDLASARPEIRDQLTAMYRRWITDNRYAMSYLTIDRRDIGHPRPSPEGDVLEVRATQTHDIRRPDANGVFVRFSDGTGWDEEYDAFVHPGDRVEFDIFVCEDSELTRGCFYSPGSGWKPFYTSGNGLNQDGVELVELDLPRGEWTRQVVGIGNYAPGTIPVNFIALQSPRAGTYHYYLDNVVIRRSDGAIRSVIWTSKSDFAPLLYRYRGANHHQLEKAQAAKGFPFSDIRITTGQAMATVTVE